MSFPLPTFPLLGSWWQTPHLPSGGAADMAAIPCQLYISPHAQYQFVNFTAPFTNPYPMTVIKTPNGANVFHRGDIIEPNTGDARYYRVGYVEIFYLGFPQVYEGLFVWQCNADGTVPRTY